MQSLPAVRALEGDLKEEGVATLLIDIHSDAGQDLLDRFDFEFTPTYILYNAGADEVWRGHETPSLDAIRARLASPPANF